MMQRRILARFYALAFCLLAAPGSAQKADTVVGRWDLTVIGTDAPYSSWLEVTRAATLESARRRDAGRVSRSRDPGRLEVVLSPYRKYCSTLLRKEAKGRMFYLDAMRDKLEFVPK